MAAGAVDARTWLRRVSFVVTGLPPGLEEVEAFAADASKEARERVVDGMLASPHFGERWARHWMDVMRYAESRGHEDDFVIANAWRYRDYLIRAFNADVPYGQLVKEHLAGDLLEPRRGPGGENESVLGTGWAFLGEEVHNPVDIRQDECERIDNKIDVLSKAFLGLTVACARCHDHKFDAVTQRDYYALSGLVQGAAFRQVRYETMEAHGEAAGKVAALRAEQGPRMLMAMGRELRGKVGRVDELLLAARRVLFGEALETVAGETGIDAAVVGGWLGAVKAAVGATGSPLHGVAMLMHEPGAGAEKVPELIGKCFPVREKWDDGEMRVIADWSRAGATVWRVDGPVFGVGVKRAGEVVFGPEGRPVSGLVLGGAAVREPFWDRLALAAGTEMDSGELGAAGRAGKTLLTPKFTIGGGRLHYLVRGRAQVYAGVDGHIMLTGGLHGGMRAEFDTAGEWRWVTHELGGYRGHRAHLEMAPPGDAGLEVAMVVEGAEVPKGYPWGGWRPGSGVESLGAVVRAWRDRLVAVAEVMASGGAVLEGQLAAADWLVRNSGLLGVDSGVVRAAGAKEAEELETMARGMRWESALGVSWGEVSGVDERVMERGKYSKPGVVAARGLPEAFGYPVIGEMEGSGRAALAEQLADAGNPLTARVMVNRIWHHVFGRGIVATVDNFGWLGERPTHPELLDHLAAQFVMEDGWSVKRMVRRLVLSDAFGRASVAADAETEGKDPMNVWWHRMPVRRLEGEAIRDALLTVSGRLDRTVGGVPVPVHLTDFIVGRGRPGVSGPLDGGGRRSIYTSVRRNFLSGMLLAFDYPVPFSAVGRRNVTNVPAQALVMLNDPMVREQAEVWVRRMVAAVPEGDDAARVRWLFGWAFGRPPSEMEAAAAMESLGEMRALGEGAAGEAAWVEFAHGLLGASEFIYLK
jgi:hypothetical protein